MWRKAQIGATIVAVALALPAGASADLAKRDRARDVRAPGLPAKDRKALDVVRVEATAISFGVLVTATMRGNVERQLGRGRLRNASVGLVLDARRRRATDRIIATAGRRGRQVAANFAPQDPYAAIVEGRQVTFIGVGVDLEKVRAMKVATVETTSRRRRRARRAQGERLIRRLDAYNQATNYTDVATFLFGERARRLLSLSLAPPTTCKQLHDLREDLETINTSLQDRLVNRVGPSGPTRATANEVLAELERVEAEIAARPQPCTDTTIIQGGGGELSFEGNASWLHFNPDHVRVDVTARAPASEGARAAASTNPVDLVEFTVPPASDGTPRQARNAACGPPLETTEISGNKVTCSGGSLPLGQTYSAAIQTSPSPTHGMGMQVRARQDGQFHGPAQLPGPQRSCGFSFNRSGSSHLVLWECSQPHSSVRFDFNVGVTKQDTGTDCQVDGSDSSVVNCNGSYGAFSPRGFTVNFAGGTCAEARFVAQTTFAPGDVQTFPEKACGG